MTKIPQKLNLKTQLFMGAVVGALYLTSGLVVSHPPFVSAIMLMLYMVCLSLWVGSNLVAKDHKLLWGFLVVLCSLILLNTAVYYVYGITKITTLLVLWLPLLTFLQKKEISASVLKLKIENLKLVLIVAFLMIEGILFATLILNRTVTLMPSPWQAVEPWFFILYALATGLLFYTVFKSKQLWLQALLTSIHLFLTFSVTPILYPLGWGFDAFVHRATEIWIQANGFILPKQPYYVGQYSFVVWLSNITHIPIFWIDVYLVPVLAAMTLPATIMVVLKRVWDIGTKYGAMLVWLIPFVPFLHLHLTTPHNVVLLLSMLAVFTTLGALKEKIHWTIPILLATTAAATHPLVGAPMFVFTILSFLATRTKKTKHFFAVTGLSIIVLAVLLPALFILNNLRAGIGLPSLVNPLARIDHFFALFARPYWYLDKAPLPYEILYGWQLLIVPAVLLLAGVGIYLLKKKERKLFTVYCLLFAGSLGFVLSGWLLRSWIVFPDIVSYEQGDFPLRIIKASLIFLLPFAMYGLYRIIKYSEKKKFLLPTAYCLLPLLLMLSLYLSYPQRNIKARFPGLNVTASDFKAVEWIHDQHDEFDYIVLSNQLTSAAALTNYSFAKYFDTSDGKIFYYAVPTGGPQYAQYGQMLYEGQKRSYMDVAMDRAGVSTGYFVINEYWADSDKIIEGAKKSADSWHVIDDGAVWIFVYADEG